MDWPGAVGAMPHRAQRTAFASPLRRCPRVLSRVIATRSIATATAGEPVRRAVRRGRPHLGLTTHAVSRSSPWRSPFRSTIPRRTSGCVDDRSRSRPGGVYAIQQATGTTSVQRSTSIRASVRPRPSVPGLLRAVPRLRPTACVAILVFARQRLWLTGGRHPARGS